jgi:hypothetical protein
MATVHELADTVKQMRGELARRIDELQNDGHMDHHGAASMSGIGEWLASFEDALRNCNGKPSPKNSYEEKVLQLIIQWKGETGFLSSPFAIIGHPAAAAIVSLGKHALPVLLYELKATRDCSYCWLMRKILNDGPDRKTIASEVVDAWLKWAEGRPELFDRC